MAATGVFVALVYAGVMLPALLSTPLGIYLRPFVEPAWLRLTGAAPRS
jgi:hypothetical protein